MNRLLKWFEDHYRSAMMVSMVLELLLLLIMTLVDVAILLRIH